MLADVPTTYSREQGFALLPNLFPPDEASQLRAAAESVLAYVAGRAARGESTVTIWPDGHRLEQVNGATIHWEPEAQVPTVRSLAPVTALDPRFDALWTDPRLTTPMRDIVGGELGPFTSKLNFKRAGEGTAFHWHQDFPFWYCCAGDSARDIANAMIFLDDATADNGALRLIPGSHLAGPAPRDRDEPTQLLADAAKVDTDRAVTVEAEAGSVLLFPGMIVHCSPANRSDSDRRSLLLCFQPAGRPRLSELTYDGERLEELP